MISHLFKLNSLPLFLIYVSVTEFEVLKILNQILSFPQIYTNNHCGRIYKQIRWLNEHIKTKHCTNKDNPY